MMEWFRSDPVSAVLYCMAIPSSVILVLQTLLTLLGMGIHGDVVESTPVDLDGDGVPDVHIDMEHGHDSIHSADGGLRLLTFRGIIAFFAVGGWSGLAALELGASPTIAVIAAFLMGAAAMILVALFFRWALRLQANGTLDYGNATGCVGEVYLTVPADAKGTGKVNVVVQERMVEADAITYGDRDLKYGEKVKVTGTVGTSTLIVEPISRA